MTRPGVKLGNPNDIPPPEEPKIGDDIPAPKLFKKDEPGAENGDGGKEEKKVPASKKFKMPQEAEKSKSKLKSHKVCLPLKSVRLTFQKMDLTLMRLNTLIKN